MDHPFAELIIGPRGSGKTRKLISTILHEVKWNNLFIFAKHHETGDGYPELKEELESRWKAKNEELKKKKLPPDDKPYMFSDSLSKFRTIFNELDKDQINLVVLDDLINDKDKETVSMMEELFTGGRHRGCSIICLVQYLKGNTGPKIRENVTHVSIFGGTTRMPERNLEELRQLFCGGDFTKKQFQYIYNCCVSIRYGFLYIDLNADEFPMKYRYKYKYLFNPIDLQNTFRLNGIK